MQDIWITHSWAVRTKRSLTIPLFISTLVSWRLRPIHDGRVFCCFSEQRKAEGGREESSCYIEELAHMISSLLTHWREPMTICPWVQHRKSHTEFWVSIAERQDLIRHVRKASGGNFYPSSRFLITLFLNNSQSGKTLDFKNSIFVFPVCLVPLLATCDKEGKSKGSLEWVGVGRMLVTQSLSLVRWCCHIAESDKAGHDPGTWEGPQKIPRVLFGWCCLATKGTQMRHSCMSQSWRTLRPCAKKLDSEATVVEDGMNKYLSDL